MCKVWNVVSPISPHYERTRSNLRYRIEGKREDKKRMPECNIQDSGFYHKMKVC